MSLVYNPIQFDDCFKYRINQEFINSWILRPKAIQTLTKGFHDAKIVILMNFIFVDIRTDAFKWPWMDAFRCYSILLMRNELAHSDYGSENKRIHNYLTKFSRKQPQQFYDALKFKGKPISLH